MYAARRLVQTAFDKGSNLALRRAVLSREASTNPPSPQPKVTFQAEQEAKKSEEQQQEAPKAQLPFWTGGKIAFASMVALTAGGIGIAQALGYEPIKQIKDKTNELNKYLETTFADPSRNELLPPMLSADMSPQHTLVIDLQDTLVHQTWDRQYGFRTLKRPGVDYFLAYLSQFYEIVIFTSDLGATAQTTIDKLDPNGFVSYRLYRDAAKYKRGAYIKDISKLNRDPKRVIVLDDDPKCVQLQPENYLPIAPWKGTSPAHDDTSLLDLIPFLESIVRDNVKDVRPVLKEALQEPDFPVSLNKRLKLDYDAEERRLKQLAATGLYNAAPAPAPYMPPSVASIPVSDIQRTITPKTVTKPVVEEKEPATIWARLRRHYAKREQAEFDMQVAFQRELEELQKQGQ